jgi:hypothetical protein
MERELLNIKIQPLPNGYALDVEKGKYMYHSLEGLTEGFMLHVGLEEASYCNKEFMKDFIATAVAWKTGDGDLVKKNIELVDENERLAHAIQTSKKTIKRLKERIKSLGKDSNESLNDEDDEDDEE